MVEYVSYNDHVERRSISFILGKLLAQNAANSYYRVCPFASPQVIGNGTSFGLGG